MKSSKSGAPHAADDTSFRPEPAARMRPTPWQGFAYRCSDDIKPDWATKRFKFFVRKAKLPQRERLRFHSLRHTAGSWLAMRGVPMRVIQAILRHSSISVTERYSHLQPEVMGAAMEEAFGGKSFHF